MRDLSLYIHIPFCKSTCLYCAFPRFANKTAKIDFYVNVLLKEIEQKSASYKNYKIETIYLGGGTPSFIPAEKIKEILAAVKKHYIISNKAEVTIECNPESLTEAKISSYLNFGINRISIGMQSLDPKTLARIGRPHRDKEIFDALKLLREKKITNFGCDFIIGLPYQTLEKFKREVETILSHNPTHLSYYFLSPDTPSIDLFIKECPTEDEQVEMYNFLVQRLKKAGYNHYEVSNYARPGFECKHNMRYWQQKEYLGLGLGAHSFINNRVWSNSSDFDTYIHDFALHEDDLKLDDELIIADKIMLNLRIAKGISKKDYRSNEYEKILKKAQSFIESGFLKQTEAGLFPTDQGFLFINTITKDLA